MNFKTHIRENQWDGLLKKSSIDGVIAGIIVWFIDLDETIFLDIVYLDYLRRKGYKSFNMVKDVLTVPFIPIRGKKKKVFFEYDMQKFMEEVTYE